MDGSPSAEMTPREFALPGIEPRSEHLVRLLTRAGRVLGSSLNLDQTLRQLLDLLVPELGDACLLHLFAPDGRTVDVELTHAIPGVADLFAEYTRRHPSSARPMSLLMHVVQTGQPEVVDEVTEAVIQRISADAGQRELIRQLRLRSLLVLPLRTPERIWGALSVALVEQGVGDRVFGATERALLEEIANRAALAVRHATLFREVETARSMAEQASQLTDRLQRVTSALGGTETPEAVYDVIVGAAFDALGAVAGGILEAGADGEFLYLRRVTGYSRETAAAYAAVPLRQALANGPGTPGWLPVHEAWLTGGPVWIPNLRACVERYGLQPTLLGPAKDASWGVLPLHGGGHLSGALTFTFPEPRAFTEQERAFAAALANQCGQALERARLRSSEAAALRAGDQGQRRLAAIVESSRDAIISKTLEGTVMSWNPAAERMFGYSGEEMLGQPIYRLIPESLHDEERELLRRVANGEVIDSFESERIRKDGRRITIAVTISPVLDANGAVAGVSSIKRDVTEQREVQRALQASEARLQAVLQQLPSGVIIAEAPSGRLVQANAQVELIWRQPTVFSTDIDGYAHYRGFHPDGRPYLQAEWPLARAIANGELVLGEEIRILRGDGTDGWISANAAPLRDLSGDIIGGVVVFSDITAQRETEERLRQSAKMEAIGRLAGGLAHDFNNQLSALSGFAHFVARDGGLGAQARQDLLQVQQAAERMAGLTRQLLAFSRQQMLTPETIELNAAVADSHPLLQRLLGSQIEMRIETPALPIWIRADRSQLLQVLMNLAINARDAMPDGGTLRIRSRVHRLPDREPPPAEAAPLPPGTYAEIIVEDSGTGIPPEVLPNIFEPFFTTKEIGKGTGLGLATVHGIVAQSRGAVWAASTPGKGAAFHVLLPLATPPDPARPVAPRRAAARSSGTILLVEDEDVVRHLVARTLADAGFDVLQARHGREALERLAQAGGAVDLVVSDMVMPVMGGRELATQLSQLYPTLPAVWMSGYPRESLAAGEAIPAGEPFLQKPVPPDLLIDAVRLAIARAGGRASGA
jgi:PAS domain S-box-containing protein